MFFTATTVQRETLAAYQSKRKTFQR
jgi:hypothetical protein